MANGYPRFPTIHNDTIVYVAEDDLWKVSSSGGVAQRLTTGLAAAADPRISQDGQHIAYAGNEEGPQEIYVVSVEGGQTTRLTYDGAAACHTRAWDPQTGGIIYSSNIAGVSGAEFRLRRVSLADSEVEELGYGRASSISFGETGAVVVGREYWKDFAHWKRYRGGTAGQLWIDPTGAGEFHKLIQLAGNLGAPNIIDNRVYFLSDHEGHGNVYSCDFNGNDLRRHTDHEGFYARSLSGDGRRLVYHCGGSVYLLDPAVDHVQKVDIDTPVTHTQRARRFVDTTGYLHSVDLSADGSRMAITSRGKAFTFGNWDGPVTQHGDSDGTRYRLLTWLHDQKRLVGIAADSGPHEEVVVIDAAASSDVVRLSNMDVGRVVDLAASPKQDKVALANHRGELLIIDLDTDTPVMSTLDSGDFGEIGELAFSPDGRWLAYSRPEGLFEPDSPASSAIKLVEVDTGHSEVVVERICYDSAPSFDPDGRYLYFIGHREFNPVYDSLHFDLGFPNGSRPYAVALRDDVPAPFLPREDPSSHGDNAATGESAGSTSSTESTELSSTQPLVQLAGIRRRIVPFPVSEGQYSQVLGISGKAVVVHEPVKGSHDIFEPDQTGHSSVDTVDLATGKVERLVDSVVRISQSADAKQLLYQTRDHLRVVNPNEKLAELNDYSRAGGWIDLTRVKVSVTPSLEWPQMLRETWRLLKEHFWSADMSGVDWDAMYERYVPLLDQISTRGELSDLCWELNGELGTSHVYERAGDYRAGPYYGQGYLGAEFRRNEDGAFAIRAIMDGDIWNPEATSAFNRPGVDAQVGDLVLAVNGRPVGGTATVGQRLVNLADQEVSVQLQRGSAPPHAVVVKALISEQPLRYRDWVNANRRKVHQATDGKVGYIHVPDMGPEGYAEFHRSYLAEYDRMGLIVDIRYNGGGHVSGLILEKLARQRLGYTHARWQATIPYPVESPRGPMVALTNELAGSDGDIFSQGFKQRALGPLIGTRTWGGVIGYTTRGGLSDNTSLSQPEFAFHFDDTKWGVENFGVEPDIEVDNAPHDCLAGNDPQLSKAIEVVQQRLETQPPHVSDPAARPRLAPAALPPRPQST